MELDKDLNIVSPNAKGELVPIPKKDVNSIDSILDNLREANKDYEMWDKLADASLDKKGYNNFYPKDEDK